jgi:3-methyladenine DNA glycosylase AlkC
MEKLKNIYNENFIDLLGKACKKEYASFQEKNFQSLILQSDWDELALKQRMRRITISLHKTLPKDYLEALSILYAVAPNFTGLAGIIFPDYVEQFGLTNWDESIHALEIFTPYSTAEFAVRPFLLMNQDKMLHQMFQWSTHQNEHIRRLASEGCRPRLPWGLSVPSLKQNPRPILSILENLKQDPSLYVRKSVANSLNDISKTHPDLVFNITTLWYGKNEHTDWIIKHACRTLLKKGDKRILAIFGYREDSTLELTHFSYSPNPLKIGTTLLFSFQIHSHHQQKLRVEYAIDFIKAKGTHSRKVFKITETEIQHGETKAYKKKHSFQDLSTRKHYKGVHVLTILVNGVAKASCEFMLDEK